MDVGATYMRPPRVPGKIIIPMASLYLHIPYCEKKCIYCDFYSIENMNSMEHFLAALEKEIRMYAERFSQSDAIDTIFFGGGTPSLLPPSTMGRILTALHSNYQIRSDAEITVETNPGTVDIEKLRGYRSLGVNRLSIGIQSFHPHELAFLSRIHTSEEAVQCVENAYRAGFENISVDLIFSLPNQTLGRWNENLRRAIALQPKHISAYSLIVEEHTPLFMMVQNKTVSPLPESLDAEIYESTIGMMAEHGYQQYEISNYAKPDYACRHNLLYWTGGEYLGLGPSAQSYLHGIRFGNIADLDAYAACLNDDHLPVTDRIILSTSERQRDALVFGLRLLHGVPRKTIKAAERDHQIDELIAKGLLDTDHDRVRLTSLGRRYADTVAEQLF